MALGTVMVVDDEVNARKTVRLTLSRAGYEVLEAEDGEEAIKVLNEGANAAKVGAILVDLQMPRMDGSAAISYFQTHHPTVPLIIMTGAPDFVLTEVMRKQGVTDYVLKPVSDKKLLQVVRVAVHLFDLRQKQNPT